MKKLLLASIIVFLSLNSIWAQSPKAFKYQAVIRDTIGITLSEQLISIKISILKGDINGDVAYGEIHDIRTNKFGLISLEIGNGLVITGDFSEISWGEDLYFVQTEIDISGGMDYHFLGSSQLLAVPYALYAETSGNSNSFWNESDSGIYYNDGNVGIGTDTPTALFDIQIPATESQIFGHEILFKAGVSDAPKDYFKILNGTLFNNRFIPFIWGHHESDKKLALGFMGTIIDKTDIGDSAVMVFSSRIHNGGENWAQVTNRPLFEWWNLGEPKMTMSANGFLGIGTTTPQRTLHVNDVIRLEPRLTPPDNPMEGDMYMDSNDHVLKVFNGTEWKSCWE